MQLWCYPVSVCLKFYVLTRIRIRKTLLGRKNNTNLLHTPIMLLCTVCILSKLILSTDLTATKAEFRDRDNSSETASTSCPANDTVADV